MSIKVLNISPIFSVLRCWKNVNEILLIHVLDDTILHLQTMSNRIRMETVIWLQLIICVLIIQHISLQHVLQAVNRTECQRWFPLWFCMGSKGNNSSCNGHNLRRKICPYLFIVTVLMVMWIVTIWNVILYELVFKKIKLCLKKTL